MKGYIKIVFGIFRIMEMEQCLKKHGDAIFVQV